MNETRRKIARGSPFRVAASPGGRACSHHWLIEPPSGPSVGGICKLCGARREFRTSADDYIREDETGSAAA